MSRSLFIVGLALAAVWVVAASYLFGSHDSDAGTDTQSTASTIAAEGEIRSAMAQLDPAQLDANDSPVKAIALEQITRVTEIGVPPPRNVSPEGATGWPSPGLNAARVPGALPASPPPEPPEPDVFRQVVVENAGSFTSGKSKITLAHIEARSSTHHCHDAKGRKWPCGQAAVTELRMLIRGRTVSCEGIKGPRSLQRKSPRTCHIGPTDLAQWLIQQGWAIPKTDAPEAYREAHLAAQTERRGIYGMAWGVDDAPLVEMPATVEIPATDAAADNANAEPQNQSDS
jgi:endonuclease YncB( thermonuclease family)